MNVAQSFHFRYILSLLIIYMSHPLSSFFFTFQRESKKELKAFTTVCLRGLQYLLRSLYELENYWNAITSNHLLEPLQSVQYCLWVEDTALEPLSYRNVFNTIKKNKKKSENCYLSIHLILFQQHCNPAIPISIGHWAKGVVHR